MLLSFGEDILVLICSFLELEDQIVLSEVCKYLQEFLVNNFWKWNNKGIYLKYKTWRHKGKRVDYSNFIRGAAPFVEEFKLNSKDLDEYGNLLRELEFPKLISCWYKEEAFEANKHRLLKIAQIFPNIKRLICEGNFQTEHILMFENLEDLHIKSLNNKICLSKVFSSLKLKKCFLDFSYCFFGNYPTDSLKLAATCPTLEHVGFVAESLSDDTLMDLKGIKKLRSVTIKFCSGEFFSSESFVDIMQVKMDEILGVKSLRRYICLKDPSFLYNKCYDEYLPRNLDEFYFLDCTSLNFRSVRRYEDAQFNYPRDSGEVRAYNFINLVKRCQSLRLLDLSSNYIAKNFIAHMMSAIDFQERRQPLILRCHRTKVTESDLQDLQLPDNLKVTLDKGIYDFDYPLPEKFFHIKFLKSD